MKEKKNLKKIFSIIGIVAIGIYLLFYLIVGNVNLFTNLKHGFSFTIISNLWSIFKNILIYGFIGAYLIYELVKKSNKKDKVMNIILFVVFCIIALSNFAGIITRGSSIAKYSRSLNGMYIISYVLDIISYIVKIGAFALFGINTMGLIINKKMPIKILTFIILGLLALVFVIASISIILRIVGLFVIKNVLLSIGSLIINFSLLIAEGSLAYIIYDKFKNIKDTQKDKKA